MSVRRHCVEHCPRCGAEHLFALKLTGAGELVFAGPGDKHDVEIALKCPNTDKLFTERISLPAEATVAEVTDAASVAPSAGYTEWVKDSRTFAAEFCRTMLATSSGAIAVYFAVLKYLGTERLDGSLGGKLSVVPPALFLVSVVVFALGLRPQLEVVTPATFDEHRAGRLERLNRYIKGGTTSFALGMAVALVVFVRALGTV